VTNLEVLGKQDSLGLREVGGGVLVGLLLRKRRTSRRPARRITDLGGEIAHDQHRGVTELLEIAQAAQDDSMTDVDVGPRWVETELGAQWTARLEFASQFGLADEVDGTRSEDVELLVDRRHSCDATRRSSAGRG
jgi:hypothetical protein